MLIAKSLLSAFIIAGSATVVAADGGGPAVNYVRNLGVSAVRQAVELHQRKLQTATPGFDLSTLTPATMCTMMPMVTTTMLADIEKDGVTCDKFGCNDAQTELEMSCSDATEFCEDDHCQKDTSVSLSIELKLDGPAKITGSQCMTYTKPAFMADMGKGCWNAEMTVDFGGIVKSLMSGMSSGTDEDDMMKDVINKMSIDSCTGTFDGGISCTCAPCKDGDDIGMTISCSNGVKANDCQEVDYFDFLTDGAQTKVKQFSEAEEDAGDDKSAAASTTKVGVASLVLAFFFA